MEIRCTAPGSAIPRPEVQLEEVNLSRILFHELCSGPAEGESPCLLSSRGTWVARQQQPRFGQTTLAVPAYQLAVLAHQNVTRTREPGTEITDTLTYCEHLAAERRKICVDGWREHALITYSA